jgi:hypothetical protein
VPAFRLRAPDVELAAAEFKPATSIRSIALWYKFLVKNTNALDK